jgi:hypothetical protein
MNEVLEFRVDSHLETLAVKRGGVWQKWTYAQYLEEIRQEVRNLC